jgi:serine/threonine-protein kinase
VRDGTLKVLDFGLAKSLDGDAASSAESQSPTLTSPAITRGGAILGTAAYMSPEQARGQPVDARTDVWAFGCVLFEMLTGKLTFEGANVSDMVASVLRSEPRWGALPAEAAPVVPVLRRCLEKDAARRFRDAGDVRLLLEDATKLPGVATTSASPRRAWLVPIAVAVGLLLGAGLASLADRTLSRPEPAPSALRRFELTPPPEAPFRYNRQESNVAIAPDASRIVYTSSRRGVPGLAIRELDRLDARFIEGSESGVDPFLSPDGTQIGFTTLVELKRVPTAGGPAATICPVDAYYSGAAWAPDDTIVFTQGILGLFRVAAQGSAPERLAAPNVEKGEKGYARPILLPDGQTVLYTLIFTDGATRIVGRQLGGGEPVTIVEDGFGPHYRPSGHLVYGQGDRLMAVRFDAATLRTAGMPVEVQRGVFNKPVEGVTNVASARDGTSVYVAGHSNPPTGRLAWLDRNGKRGALVTAEPLEGPRNLRLSPDGRRAVVTVGPMGQGGQLWVFDLTGSRQPLKLTFRFHNSFAVWSPDGKRLAYMSRDGATTRLLSLPADGSSTEPENMGADDRAPLPLDWLPHPALLLVQELQPRKLVLLSVGDRTASRWLHTPFHEAGARFSPDGRWLAYASNPTGTWEVFVRPFPGPGEPVRVSSDGGHKPTWSRDGRELFYESGNRLISARVLSLATGFGVEAPRVLFEGGVMSEETDLGLNLRFLDAAPDGRFLVLEPASAGATASMVVVEHWDDELKRLLPR